MTFQACRSASEQGSPRSMQLPNSMTGDRYLLTSPRRYTPMGEALVTTAHEEFLAFYLAGLAKGDALYRDRYVHEMAILALGRWRRY